MKSETFLDGRVTIWCGDSLTVLKTMPSDSVDCVVTSPPYWGLRDYGTARWEGGNPKCKHEGSERYYTEKSAASGGSGEAFSKPGPENAERLRKARWRERGVCKKCGAVHVDEQLGMERSLGEHIGAMVEVFREVRRVLKPTGTLWLNYGDCYATAPNGRSASDTKAVGNDDRTFRDKPFSTIGAIYEHDCDVVYGKHAYGAEDQRQSRGRIRAGGILKPKDLCMVPNRLAIALQDDGWWVRSEIIWHKPNPMPESTRDRPTSSHEKIWLLTKQERYFYDAEAIAERASASTHARISQNLAAQIGSHRANGGGKTNGPMKAVVKGSTRKLAKAGSGIKNNSSFTDSVSLLVETRNSRNVWTMGTHPFSEAHFATFPPELAERCIKAGCPAGGVVLDVFGGSGTTGMVAASLGRSAVLIELNPEYATMARSRIESAFMGKEEGQRHMVKALGKTEDAGPLFSL